MRIEIGTGQENIIRNGALLGSEADPEDLIGRDEQRQQLHACLTPSFRGRPSINVWVSGPPGSGKTLLAAWAAGQVCSTGSCPLSLHINCWQHRTFYSVLQAIIDQLRILGADTQDTSIKLDRVGQALRDRPAVIILDEIDRPMPAEGNEILYGLLTLHKTALICIANSNRALAMLDERVQSRLSPILIELPAYSDMEIEDILTDRAQRALARGTWSPAIIRQIAAGSGGDARLAIQILRQAAAAAEQSGRPGLDGRDIGRILGQWRAVRSESRVAPLSVHEKLIQELAVRDEPIGTTKLAGLYADRCRKQALQPVARRTFSKYLDRLISAGVLEVRDYHPKKGGRIIQAVGHNG